MTKTKISLVSLSALFLPVLAFAISSQVAPTEGSIGSMASLVTKIENFVWVVFGLIAVIAFVTAGILFLTAGGQPEKVQSARSAFIWGIVGVVVGIIAYSILAIIGTAVGVG